MNPKAILFDMDGVVVDSMRFHASAWRQVLGEYGIAVEDIDIYLREGMSGRQSVEDIFREYGRPVPDEARFNELVARKHAIFERNRIALFPCMEEILDHVAAGGLRAALVTGSVRRSVDHVLEGRFLSLFNAVITAEDVSNGKPDPEPYARALERVGVDPSDALAIENAPMGIRSARGAGVTCYAIETTLPRRYLKEADEIFADHCSLLEHLRSGRISMGRAR